MQTCQGAYGTKSPCICISCLEKTKHWSSFRNWPKTTSTKYAHVPVWSQFLAGSLNELHWRSVVAFALCMLVANCPPSFVPHVSSVPSTCRPTAACSVRRACTVLAWSVSAASQVAFGRFVTMNPCLGCSSRKDLPCWLPTNCTAFCFASEEQMTALSGIALPSQNLINRPESSSVTCFDVTFLKLWVVVAREVRVDLACLGI